jgi:hypothetical protein
LGRLDNAARPIAPQVNHEAMNRQYTFLSKKKLYYRVSQCTVNDNTFWNYYKISDFAFLMAGIWEENFCFNCLMKAVDFSVFGDVIWIKKVIYSNHIVSLVSKITTDWHDTKNHILLCRCRNNGILEYWNDDIHLRTHFSIIPSFQFSKGASVHNTIG